MIKCFLIFGILFLFYSCKESIPSVIIKPKEMQEILWDVLKADALSQQLVINDSTRSLADESVKLRGKVFLIHDVTEGQFEKSYSYYTRHPDIMRIMLDSLNAQQIRMNILSKPFMQKILTRDSAK